MAVILDTSPALLQAEDRPSGSFPRPPKLSPSPRRLNRGTAQFALALVVLHLSNPLCWASAYPPLWFPPAGIGLALLAWFGPRALPWLVAAAGTSALQVWLTGAGHGNGWTAALASTEMLMAALEAGMGWLAYHRLARGARDVGDPRSALLFLLLIPGAAVGLGALGRAALNWAIGTTPTLAIVAVLWIEHALGIVVLAPPLLAAFTPWLVRRDLVREETPDAAPLLPGPVGADRMTLGDKIEVGGLTLCAAALGLLLTLSPGAATLAAWQLWGAPLLLVVWASLRQGLSGGVLVACAAVALPLAALTGTVFHPGGLLLGTLLVRAGAAVLVAVSVSWLRVSDQRYRQLVAHVPVVVYSARLIGEPAAAEVTLVSAASTTTLGCPTEHLLGDYGNWLAHVHPDDREVLQAALTQLERQNQPVTCEYRFAGAVPATWKSDSDPWTPDGRGSVIGARNGSARLRWVRDTLAPHRDADGRLAGWEGVVTDITEQRTLADDLRRTTSMLHGLVSNLPAGVFFVQGPQGRPVLVNARARQLLGQREEVTMAHLASTYRLHKPDGSPYPSEQLPVVRALCDGTTTMRDDIVVHRPDGRRVPLVTWAAPVDMGTAGSDGAVWVLEDLTALHQAEAARRDSEGRLRAVVEAMGEALIVQDRKGIIVDANPAAANLFGGEPAGLRGQAVFDLGWEHLRENGTTLPTDEHPANAALRNGHPVRNALLGLRRRGGSGTVRWVIVNAMPLGQPPAPAGVVTTFAEVTHYRDAQEGIRSSEERYRGLVETMPLVLIQTDRDLRLTYCNPATRKVTGYELADIAAREAWSSTIHADDLQRVLRVADACLHGQPGRAEFRYRSKDGCEKAAVLIVQPRRDGDAIDGVTALLVDVTRERRLEGELQRAQRLETVAE